MLPGRCSDGSHCTGVKIKAQREFCISSKTAQLASGAAGFTPRQSDASSRMPGRCTVLPLDVGKEGKRFKVSRQGAGRKASDRGSRGGDGVWGWGILSEAGEKAGRKKQTCEARGGKWLIVRWFGEVGRWAGRRGRGKIKCKGPGEGGNGAEALERTDGWSERLQGSKSQERSGFQSE